MSKDDKELNIMQKIFQEKINNGKLYNIFSMNGACSDFAVQVLTEIVKERNKELPEGKELDIENFKTAKKNGKTETCSETAYNNALSSAQNAHNKEQPSNSNKEQSSTSNNEDSRIGRITNHISDSSIEGFGNSLLRLVQDSLVSKDDKELNIMQETFQNKLDAGELYNIVSMDGACSDFAAEVVKKLVIEKNKELPEGKELDISKFKIDKTKNGKTETLVATAYNNALSSAQNAHNKEQPSNSNKEQSSTSNNEDSRIGRIKNHISDSSIEGLGNSISKIFQDNLVISNNARALINQKKICCKIKLVT